MRAKPGSSILCLAVLVASGVGAQEPPDLDEVIESYFDAIGGRDAAAAVQQRVMRGAMFIPAMNMEGSFEYIAAPPNMISTVEFTSMGVRSQNGFIDGVAWQLDPMAGPMILTGANAVGMRLQASMDYLLDWEEYFDSAEVVGAADVEGAPATQVDFRTADGTVVEAYFEEESGLMTQQVLVDDATRSSVLFRDYRPVGSLLVPHTMVLTSAQGDAEITLETIEHNGEIPEGAIELPAQIRAMQN